MQLQQLKQELVHLISAGDHERQLAAIVAQLKLSDPLAPREPFVSFDADGTGFTADLSATYSTPAWMRCGGGRAC